MEQLHLTNQSCLHNQAVSVQVPLLLEDIMLMLAGPLLLVLLLIIMYVHSPYLANRALSWVSNKIIVFYTIIATIIIIIIFDNIVGNVKNLKLFYFSSTALSHLYYWSEGYGIWLWTSGNATVYLSLLTLQP